MKTVQLTLETAKEMYNSDIVSLKQFALSNYTEEELTKKKFPKEYKKEYALLCPVVDVNSEENAKALIMLSKLITMRDLWWKIDGNWKPDWKDYIETKYVIYNHKDDLRAAHFQHANTIFCFRTLEIRNEFLETFRESLEVCKSLL